MKNNYSNIALKILTSSNYKDVNSELEKYDSKTLYEFLKFAINNRILYALSKKILEISPQYRYSPILKYIVKKGDDWQIRLKNTLLYLDDVFGEEQYVVIKTFRKFQDITFDVDVMMINNDLKIFKKRADQIKKDFKIKKIIGGYELIPNSDNYLSIDIYTCFNYNNKRLFSWKIILNNPRKIQFGNNTYLVPSYEGELLLYLTQIIFQLRFLTLSDFIQIVDLMNRAITWNLIISEAKKHNWDYLLRSLMNLIKNCYYRYFDAPLVIPSPLESENKKEYRGVTFPIILPPIPTIIGYSIFYGTRNYFVSKKVIRDIHYVLLEYFSLHVREKIPIYRPWIDIPHIDSRHRDLNNPF